MLIVSRKCNDILVELSGKVELLRIEIDKSKKPQVQSIQNLIDVGIEQVKFTKVDNSNDISITTLAFVNEQVKEKLQDILPEGENTLSSKASKLVNEIVELIEASSTVQKELENVQTNVNNNLNALKSYTGKFTNAEEFDSVVCKKAKGCIYKYEDNVNVIIEKATRLIDIATSSKSTTDQVLKAKKDAVAQIINTIKIVETKLKPLTGNKEDALNLIETLLLALTGIQGWVANLEEISNFQFVSKSQTSQYIQTKFTKIDNSPKDELARLIGGTCGRESLNNESNTITWYICVTKGKKKITSPYETSDIITDLLKLLTFGEIWNWWRSVCNPSNDENVNRNARKKLAEGLVKFI